MLNSSLIKFVLVSVLIAHVCFAADKLDPSIVQCNVPRNKDEVDSLTTMIIKKHPELLPPFLVACKGWDGDLAIAFALGLALGKQCDQPKFMNTSTNTKYEMIEWKYVETGPGEGKRVTVHVKNLDKALSANWEWRYGSETYNPLAELFDSERIPRTESKSNYIEKARRILAQYAKKSIAMVAIDVANLKWMVHAIKTNPLDCHMIEISEAIFMPLCALSMIPQVREYCMDDILIVLTEVQKFTGPEFLTSFDIQDYNRSLFTLFKMLDDGPIRKVLEEIVKVVCPYSSLSARLILGDDHSIVRSSEETISNEKRTLLKTLFDCQAECHRKVYTICKKCIHGYANSRLDPNTSGFITIYINSTLSAIILPGKILKWEGTAPTLGKEINFSNNPSPHPRQVRLFIISQLPGPVPLQFWQDITSCTTIVTFQKILEKPATRQIILTYGITILESSSIYNFNPA